MAKKRHTVEQISHNDANLDQKDVNQTQFADLSGW